MNVLLELIVCESIWPPHIYTYTHTMYMCVCERLYQCILICFQGCIFLSLSFFLECEVVCVCAYVCICDFEA